MFRAYGSFPSVLQTSASAVSPTAAASSSQKSTSSSIDTQQLIESLLPSASVNTSLNDTNNTWSTDALPQLLNDFNQFFISNVNLNGTTSQSIDELSVPYTGSPTASQYPIGSRRKTTVNTEDLFTYYSNKNGSQRNGKIICSTTLLK